MGRSLGFNKENFIGAKEGEKNEAILCGFVDTSIAKYKLAERGYQQDPGDKRETPFIGLEKSRRLAKEFQAEKAFDPPTQFLKELRIEVADRLGLNTAEEMERLAIFTAIGRPRKTSLDLYHGVDAFITYNKPGLPEIVVTLDASWSSEKNASEIKADIYVDGRDIPDPTDDEKFLAAVEKTANKIAKLINKRIDGLITTKERTGARERRVGL